MSLGMIEKANIYAAEIQFKKINENFHNNKLAKLQKSEKSGDILNIYKAFAAVQMHFDERTAFMEKSLSNDIMSLHTSGILSQSFCLLLKEKLLPLVFQSIQIKYDNCYSKLLKPLLYACDLEDITIENLKGLLNEIGIVHIESVVSNLIVKSVGISYESILPFGEACSFEEKQKVPAAEDREANIPELMEIDLVALPPSYDEAIAGLRGVFSYAPEGGEFSIIS